MIRNLLILGGVMVITIAYTALSGDGKIRPSSSNPANIQNANRADIAPDFTFTDIMGAGHALSDFADKVVVLNFWASWCAPCVIEFPMMLRLADATKEQSVFLFLSVDEDKADIERFLKRHAKNYGAKNVFVAHDLGKAVSQGLYNSYKLPETYIIAPGGMIVEKIIGADVEWDGPAMIEKIKSLHGKSAD